jgi:catechol 2,3-dioxygenase-like lactoylglutathione lyase family enzyme
MEPRNLTPVEIKAFVPARDYELSKQFYRDMGFTMASDGGGVAYFHRAHAAFLLQDGCAEGAGRLLTMHLLVEDVDAWWTQLSESELPRRYGVKMSNVHPQPWRMRDFVLEDPSGVTWRIAQNTA